MDANQVRYFCAEYGEWYARLKYRGLNLGFPKENIIYRMLKGKISFDKHTGARELSIEETPKEYKGLEYVLDRMESSNPDAHAVFMMHWCVFFIKKKRANIRLKAKELGISESLYHERKNQAMAIVNFYFIDIQGPDSEWVDTQLRAEFEKIP